MLINNEKSDFDSIPITLRGAERRMTAEDRRELYHRFVSDLDFLPDDHLRVFSRPPSGIIKAVPEGGRWRQLPLMGCASVHRPGKVMSSDPDFALVEDIQQSRSTRDRQGGPPVPAASHAAPQFLDCRPAVVLTRVCVQ